MKLTYIINDNKYESITHVLKEEFSMSSRLILKLKKNKKITLNSKIVSINNPIKIGDILEVFIDFIEDSTNIVPVKMPLNIIYEDDAMLIVNKSAGIPVHPSMLHYKNSLSNGVKYYFDSIGLNKKIRPVNRLDKDTSRNCYFCKK
ncbi:MAG: hypothetical protein HFJ57_02210 [Clostridia bacterium]|nr:hypothetical protein [Clostridia bacterium]